MKERWRRRKEEKANNLIEKGMEEDLNRLNEQGIQDFVLYLYDSFKKELEDAGFDIIRSECGDRASQTVNQKMEKKEDFLDKKVRKGLCSLRFFLKTDEEIDKVVKWFEKNHSSTDEDDLGKLRVRDFREKKGDVCLLLPFVLNEETKLMEIYLAKEEDSV